MPANKTDKLWRWLIGITVIFAVTITVILFVSSNSPGLAIQQKIQFRNQALITTAILFLGLGVIINAYYAAKRIDAIHKSALAAEKNVEINVQNAKLSENRLISERLMTAITQLGHEKIETRTGAIYVLEKVAQDFPQEHWTVMEILTAFVRENAPAREVEVLEEDDSQPTSLNRYKQAERQKLQQYLHQNEESAKIRSDVQVALTVIGRRNYLQDEDNKRIDLRNVNLRRVELLGANLQKADLRGCDLRGADLRGCDFSGANLDSVKLAGAILFEAIFLKANLQGADIQGANLNRADLSGANLRGANLMGASLRAATLQGANLYKVNLQQAILKLANLSGAKLFLANMQGAKLGKANLSLCGLIGANLNGANLNGVNLSGANLNAAKLQQAEVLFADFTEASLTEADLYKANLMGANLQRTSLYQANLSQVNLVGANLANANFCDVKLAGAILTGVKNLKSEQISLAFGDRSTRLPDSFEIPIHWRQSS
ncbi:pentapeptide repeat-containing protein [Nostoc sp. MS1]|uniref:pentapeptide repeat-containing protein n=1 Tax=Nostoc sp. MS1 TaxID=2764711 RepID=UPI001CC82AFA|nr:pentapeptide repeat-containing protein [Nostoc sp. MS1]BCL37589.1 hypothetical protein NSMS1_40360 [Nostoc sp. MS1]